MSLEFPPCPWPAVKKKARSFEWVGMNSVGRIFTFEPAHEFTVSKLI